VREREKQGMLNQTSIGSGIKSPLRFLDKSCETHYQTSIITRRRKSKDKMFSSLNFLRYPIHCCVLSSVFFLCWQSNQNWPVSTYCVVLSSNQQLPSLSSSRARILAPAASIIDSRSCIEKDRIPKISKRERMREIG
jgi:hypothetical protein